MKTIFSIFIYTFIGAGIVNTQEHQPFHQIFLQDTIIDLKKVEYVNDTTGKRLGFKLSEDRTTIQLFNYDGFSRVKIEYVSRTKGLFSETRYKCNIHSLPVL
jgi:hypothetical protein